MKFSVVVSLLCAGGFVGSTVGCGGSGPKTYDVSGKVTFQGEPIPEGVIQFSPDSSQGNSGVALTANIVDGEYSTRDSEKGTVGGPHRVSIRGFNGVTDLEQELPHGEPLFPGFETSVDLPEDDAEDVDFDVRL